VIITEQTNSVIIVRIGVFINYLVIGGFEQLTNNTASLVVQALRLFLLPEPLWIRRLEEFDQKKNPSDPWNSKAVRLFVSCLNPPLFYSL